MRRRPVSLIPRAWSSRGERGGILTRRTRLVPTLLLALIAAAVGGPAIVRGDEPVVVSGTSDATSVAVKSGQFSNGNFFWWDHTHLTVAVRASGALDPAKVQAVHDAIGVWASVLQAQLPEVTLTDVTEAEATSADIVLHYVPHSSGSYAFGKALCSGSQRCLNIIVKSELPPGQVGASGEGEYDALRVERETIHMLGHALGLGHADPVVTSRDAMAFGWESPGAGPPILSTCDIAGVRAAFAWYFAGEPPHAATVGRVLCQ